MIDNMGSILGVDPSIIRSDDEAKALAAAEAKQQAQMASTDQGKVMADTAKTVSEIDTGDNMLSKVMGRAGLG